MKDHANARLMHAKAAKTAKIAYSLILVVEAPVSRITELDAVLVVHANDDNGDENLVYSVHPSLPGIPLLAL